MDPITQTVICSELLGILQGAPKNEAIGASLAFLLYCADTDPWQLNRVLRSVDGMSNQGMIIEILMRVARMGKL